MKQFSFECPYCGVQYDGLEFLDTGDMDGEFEMQCDNCDEEFSVEFETTITFKYKKK